MTRYINIYIIKKSIYKFKYYFMYILLLLFRCYYYYYLY
nr:MAG TPA: hypothetical protein [Caudoviricetes sp.]